MSSTSLILSLTELNESPTSSTRTLNQPLMIQFLSSKDFSNLGLFTAEPQIKAIRGRYLGHHQDCEISTLNSDEIHTIDEILVHFDETGNLYKITRDYYLQLLRKEVHKNYKITDNSA